MGKIKSNRLFLYNQITKFLPETRFFNLKRTLLRWTGIEIGNNVRLCSSARIIGSGQLVIGDNTWIGHGCLIAASSLIRIGSNCDIAPLVFIGTGTHQLTPDASRVAGIENSLDITIGNGCWIGVRATILPGVEIADKTVVAACSTITHSFSENRVLLAGTPAQIKKHL